MAAQLVLKGKNLDITEDLRSYIEKRANKLDRYLPDLSEVRIDLSVQKTRSSQDRQVAQMTVRSNGVILRAEERAEEMSVAIDAVIEKMHRQIARYKGKRVDRWQGHVTGRVDVDMPPLPSEVLEELAEQDERRIVRTKRFFVAPMTEDEAIEQMELLGHDFFIFYNPNHGLLNVLYRRRDGNYGLLEPELG
jgi:putative sigma-54 modulation protein